MRRRKARKQTTGSRLVKRLLRNRAVRKLIFILSAFIALEIATTPAVMNVISKLTSGLLPNF